MSHITFEKYCAIESTVTTVSNAVRMTGTKDVCENMKTAEYVMAVIRSHARTEKDGFETPEDRAEFLESLFSALYR